MGKYQERFLETDAEVITYITKDFTNTEVCDELIEECENDCAKEEEKSVQIFNKKEDFLFNNSCSEFRN